eukprot:3992393-Alexandrium_andersonii.AAC.1
MSASLVGSEMCIRDRPTLPVAVWHLLQPDGAQGLGPLALPPPSAAAPECPARRAASVTRRSHERR